MNCDKNCDGLDGKIAMIDKMIFLRGTCFGILKKFNFFKFFKWEKILGVGKISIEFFTVRNYPSCSGESAALGHSAINQNFRRLGLPDEG